MEKIITEYKGQEIIYQEDMNVDDVFDIVDDLIKAGYLQGKHTVDFTFPTKLLEDFEEGNIVIDDVLFAFSEGILYGGYPVKFQDNRWWKALD